MLFLTLNLMLSRIQIMQLKVILPWVAYFQSMVNNEHIPNPHIPPAELRSG